MLKKGVLFLGGNSLAMWAVRPSYGKLEKSQVKVLTRVDTQTASHTTVPF